MMSYDDMIAKLSKGDIDLSLAEQYRESDDFGGGIMGGGNLSLAEQTRSAPGYGDGNLMAQQTPNNMPQLPEGAVENIAGDPSAMASYGMTAPMPPNPNVQMGNLMSLAMKQAPQNPGPQMPQSGGLMGYIQQLFRG